MAIYLAYKANYKANREEKKKMSEKKPLFCVEAAVWLDGDYWEERREFTRAKDPAQAMTFVAARIKKEKNKNVMLKNCDVSTEKEKDIHENLLLKKLLPHKKRKREEQLRLFISYLSSHEAP